MPNASIIGSKVRVPTVNKIEERIILSVKSVACTDNGKAEAEVVDKEDEYVFRSSTGELPMTLVRSKEFV
jgi:hypothetical protein